jgi:STE24 endopeptidase
MPLFLLMILMLVCTSMRWPRPPYLENSTEDVIWASVLSWSAMGLGVLSAAMASRNVRQILRKDPHQRNSAMSRYAAFRFVHFYILAGLYLTALYVFGWGWAAWNIAYVERWNLVLPGAELLVLAPFLLGLLLSWACYYDAERALYDSAHPLVQARPFWSRWAYVGFFLRLHFAMIALPATNFLIVQGVYRCNPALFELNWFWALIAGVFIVQVICLPWLMRILLGLHQLPAGPLRERLLASAKRLDLRCSDILLWNTRSGIANALVVGMIPALRYVFLSDRLVEEMSPEEIEGVFGHEVGHLKHHHLLFYAGFILASGVVLSSFWETVQMNLRINPATEDWMNPLIVGTLGLYLFVFFGFLSRRCERQADIHGCRALSCGRPDCLEHDGSPLPPHVERLCPTGIRTFIRALDKVASINGMVRSTPKGDFAWTYSPRGVLRLFGQLLRMLPAWVQTWQHSTFERRIAFLQAMLNDPTLEPRFQQRIGRVKWGVILVLVCLFGVIKMLPG